METGVRGWGVFKKIREERQFIVNEIKIPCM